MKTLTLLSGLALHFADEGEGIPLVFSNSLGTDMRVWAPLLARLPAGFRIIRYDTAGHGLSDFAGERPISAHAEDLATLLDHLGVREAVFIGLSVGGLIGQALYQARPDLIRAMIFCDTAHKIGTADVWNERLALIEKGGIEAQEKAILERWFTSAFREANPAFPLWRNMLTRTTVQAYCSLGRAIRDADFTAEAASVTVPALCICGADDGSTPPALMQAFSAMLPLGQYVEIAECGHLPCVEQPEVMVGNIVAYIEEISQAVTI